MTTDRFSLYSVIIISIWDSDSGSSSRSQENSKIALPTTESATITYLAINLSIN